jgi:hypothetical protein
VVLPRSSDVAVVEPIITQNLGYWLAFSLLIFISSVGNLQVVIKGETAFINSGGLRPWTGQLAGEDLLAPPPSSQPFEIVMFLHVLGVPNQGADGAEASPDT